MNSFTDVDVQNAVDKGVTWFDRKHPEWFNKINLKSLVMNSCALCVIGQAVGNYFDTVYEAIGVDYGNWEDGGGEEWAIEHGFQAPTFHDAENGTFEHELEKSYYGKLEALWAVKVLERRS